MIIRACATWTAHHQLRRLRNHVVPPTALLRRLEQLVGDHVRSLQARQRVTVPPRSAPPPDRRQVVHRLRQQDPGLPRRRPDQRAVAEDPLGLAEQRECRLCLRAKDLVWRHGVVLLTQRHQLLGRDRVGVKEVDTESRLVRLMERPVEDFPPLAPLLGLEGLGALLRQPGAQEGTVTVMVTLLIRATLVPGNYGNTAGETPHEEFYPSCEGAMLPEEWT